MKSNHASSLFVFKRITTRLLSTATGVKYKLAVCRIRSLIVRSVKSSFDSPSPNRRSGLILSPDALYSGNSARLISPPRVDIVRRTLPLSKTTYSSSPCAATAKGPYASCKRFVTSVSVNSSGSATACWACFVSSAVFICALRSSIRTA